VIYGYGAAQTLTKILEMCGDDLTRANIMKQACEPERLHARHAVARRQDQHVRHRLCADRAASDDALQGREVGDCSATSSAARRHININIPPRGQFPAASD
jgi:hypothetical protein